MVKQPETPSNFDMSKLIGDFKLPGMDLETIVAFQRKNVEALAQANKLAFEGAQAMFKREIEIARQVFEESAQIAKSMSEPGSPQDKAIRQTELAKETFEKALVNTRELSDIVSKSNNEAADLLNRRFGEMLDEIKDSIAKTRQAA